MTPGTRILVADDEPDLLQSVAAVLRQEGAEVVCAASGAELITKMAERGRRAHRRRHLDDALDERVARDALGALRRARDADPCDDGID